MVVPIQRYIHWKEIRNMRFVPEPFAESNPLLQANFTYFLFESLCLALEAKLAQERKDLAPLISTRYFSRCIPRTFELKFLDQLGIRPELGQMQMVNE